MFKNILFAKLTIWWLCKENSLNLGNSKFFPALLFHRKVLTMAPITAETFRLVACEMLFMDPNSSAREQAREFTEFFGTSYDVCEDVWRRINPTENVHPNAKPKHLLWALLFLFNYCTEKINCKLVGIRDPKTYRYWTWMFVDAIADLEGELVSW